MQLKREKKVLKREKGITLVALVVTIVVLLILAGIMLTYVLGDNSVFKQVQEAKLKTDIANWQEKLEMAKSPISIQGLGTFNADDYFQYIQEQGIINDKTKDVIDNKDGTYDITIKPGYVFLVTLMLSPENPTDAKIEYIGKAGKIPPIIRRIEVSATQISITGKAIVSRLGKNGTIKYYYKSTSAADSTYKEITNVNDETGATQSTEITAGESYTIKVVVKNDIGEVELTQEITATKVPAERITLKATEVVAVGKTVTLTATVKPDDATNKNVTWESSNTSIATVSDTGMVTGKTEGIVTITAKATDGSDKTGSCEVTVKSVSLNKTSTTIQKGKTETLIATVLPANASNKNVTWSSSNETIATVSSTGVVTGKSKGTTTITVSTTDIIKATASCTVTIEGSSLSKIVGQKQISPKTVTDDNGNKVVVPDGFRVLANGTENADIAKAEYNYDTIDHDPNVQDGVVVADDDNNQFVWVPVNTIKNKDGTTTTITLGRYSSFSTSAIPVQTQSNYLETVTINSCQEFVNQTGNIAHAKNLKKFIDNAILDNGYWLARYETSNSSGAKSKYDKIAWVNITQANASTAAQNMKSNGSYQSDLVNSYAWDTAIIFIEKMGHTGYAKQKSKNPSKLNTGKSGDRVCNIFDMASNCNEVSTEIYNPNREVSRGGMYQSGQQYAYGRYDGSAGDSFSGGSFRCLLYKP